MKAKKMHGVKFDHLIKLSKQRSEAQQVLCEFNILPLVGMREYRRGTKM